jgi:tRNA nucleotidyltransferase (CCA-adding enzyme)
MKIYLVGGAVRDKLLGLPIKERDWVVVDATPAQMLAAGFRQVGKEFPVFLHPKTHEEYALARTERKIGPGYTGFTFDISQHVSLEEDLIRRDLTINAMAETETGELIDPYHGQKDLQEKYLRHVSLAFVEDPVRLLRVARFLARYHHLGFRIAEETLHLMQKMVAQGEVNALVAERVWKECERALSEKNPEQFFFALEKCHALAVLFPEIRVEGKGLDALMIAAKHRQPAIIGWAVLLNPLNDQKQDIVSLCERYRTPHDYRELAVLTALYHTTILNALSLSASTLLDLFYKLDIFRRASRFDNILTACAIIAEAQNLTMASTWLKDCANAVKSYPVNILLAEGWAGNELAAALKKEREKIIIHFITTRATK